MTPRIVAIDPGPVQSAIVVLENGHLIDARTLPNATLNAALREIVREVGDTLVVEQMACYGMPVGAEVFRTVWWSGRFAESWLWGHPPATSHFAELPRQQVKLHLCGQARAKDANIRQALVDRFGPGTAAAIGTKRHRGPLYGVTGDQWAALAVAVTWWDGLTALTEAADGATVRGAEGGDGPRHDHARERETP